MADSPEVAHLLDIPLEVEAIVEGPVLRVGELMALAVGSLVTTKRVAGETVDLMAGGAWIGAGELAGVNGRRVVRMVRFKGAN